MAVPVPVAVPVTVAARRRVWVAAVGFLIAGDEDAAVEQAASSPSGKFAEG